MERRRGKANEHHQDTKSSKVHQENLSFVYLGALVVNLYLPPYSGITTSSSTLMGFRTNPVMTLG